MGETEGPGAVDAMQEVGGDDAVAAPRAERERIRQQARRDLGVTGTEDSPPLAQGIARSGVGWYPLIALGLMVVVDEFQQYTITVLGPEITAGLGISKAALAMAILIKTVVVSLALLPIAAWVQHTPRRAFVSVVSAFAWGMMTLGTGFVVTVWGLIAVMAADGATTGSVRAVHEPLLADTYPPDVRNRALSFYRGADRLGSLLGPLLVGLCTAVLGLTWRGVFVAAGVLCLFAAAVTVRLRDPGFGAWDTERARSTVRDAVNSSVGAADEVELGFFEVTRRLLLIPTIRRVLIGWSVVGMLLVPFTVYLTFFLQERWGMGPGERSIFFATMPLFAFALLAAFGGRGERMFRRDPASLMRFTGLVLTLSVAGIAGGIFSPTFPVTVVLLGTAMGLTAILIPALNTCVYALVPGRMRAHLAALTGIALAAVGGGAGLLLLGGIETRFGTGGAIVSLTIPGVVAGVILRSAATTVNDDLDRMLDGIIEDEEVQAARRRGESMSLLSCRGVDFSYGQLQVLFHVDFSVEDGEMVALLGTNGAGKSTLLRLISGLGLPSRGTVRLDGTDISYVSPERRVRLGINQIPGGRAVFGPMTVAENLRAFAYTHGVDYRAADRGIEACFDAFPALAERRNQRASTLSGGEQQMLGLSTAFILRPRLLLIDELSLGLAPIVVGRLLTAVREINAFGTAVVLVEQSANVALTVADRAYFLERGTIRFEGDAKHLLERTDLLRSVFLEGADSAAGGTSPGHGGADGG